MPPNPYKYPGNNRSEPYGGPWHWSVYAKKALLPNLTLTAQVARDHTFIETSMTGLSNGDPKKRLTVLEIGCGWPNSNMAFNINTKYHLN